MPEKEHCEAREEARKERVRELAMEMKRLIDNNFTQTRNPVVLARVAALKGEIERMGLMVEIEYSLNLETLACNSDINVWEPKQIQ